MVDHKMKLGWKTIDLILAHRLISGIKKIFGFVGRKLVSYIIFIFKIKVKSSFGDTGLFNNVGNCSLVGAFGCKKFKSGII